MDKSFIIYRQTEDDDGQKVWTYIWTCDPLDIKMLIGPTVGLFLADVIGKDIFNNYKSSEAALGTIFVLPALVH